MFMSLVFIPFIYLRIQRKGGIVSQELAVGSEELWSQEHSH